MIVGHTTYSVNPHLTDLLSRKFAHHGRHAKVRQSRIFISKTSHFDTKHIRRNAWRYTYTFCDTRDSYKHSARASQQPVSIDLCLSRYVQYSSNSRRREEESAVFNVGHTTRE